MRYDIYIYIYVIRQLKVNTGFGVIQRVTQAEGHCGLIVDSWPYSVTPNKFKYFKYAAIKSPFLCSTSTYVILYLKTKRNIIYIRHQSVPRCKHIPPRL